MEIWAKKLDDEYQSLEEHTFLVLDEAFKQLDEKTLSKVADFSGWPSDKIKDLIFFSVYFHDIGKATFEFQETIKNGRKSFHSLYSASLLESIRDFEFLEDDVYINLLLLIVLTHHSLFPYKASSSKFSFLPESQEFFKDYKRIYKEVFKKDCNYNFDFTVLEDMKFEIENIENDLKEIKEKNKIRILYSYVSGILNSADWLASARFSQSSPKVNFTLLPNKENFIQKLNFDNLKEFQEKLADFNTSVLVEIPTGEGKTEASLLWAINNLSNENTKIIYTLPTQTTSNKLYERVQNLFDKDECGLIHSNAIIFLQKEYERDKGIVDEQFKSNFLLSKSFNKPVTVCTLDSLLKYFINIGRFNIATKNFLNSVVIIDEVHSYDFKLMGFLKRFLELCEEYKVKVCLMSASIPKQVKKLLNIENYPLISQADLFDKKANEIFKKDYDLDEDFELIYKKFKEEKTILVIRNTIQSAVKTYKYLKEIFSLNEEIMLYHSTFKKEDKGKKEALIFEKLASQKAFILVATQIVEISLDIDFSIMFTDNAPIDSLIQRFGRVNRKKKEEKKGEIFIYKYDKAFPYKNLALLDLTFKTIQNGYFTLEEYKKWLNIVYDELFEADKVIQNNITRLFDEAYKKYDKTLKELAGINKSKDNYDLRDIEVTKNDYLLHHDFIEDKIKYDFTISLPSYLEKSYLHITQKDLYYKVLKLPYSFEEGIIFNDKDDNLFIDG